MASESRDLESENAKLHKTCEALRHSLRRLNDLEKENTDLEADNHRLDRESKGLHKEIARLKQAIEVSHSSSLVSFIHSFVTGPFRLIERPNQGDIVSIQPRPFSVVAAFSDEEVIRIVAVRKEIKSVGTVS